MSASYAGAALKAGAPSEARDRVYSALLGRWKGQLEYRDFTSNQHVKLPTRLEITRAPGADEPKVPATLAALRFHYTYDDGPGKVVEETSAVTVDPAQDTYTVVNGAGTERDTYRILGLNQFAHASHGKLMLVGTGEENNSKVEVRKTISLSVRALTILKETRLPNAKFMFRNRYTLTREDEASAR